MCHHTAQYKKLHFLVPTQKTPLKKNTNKSELRTQNIYNFTQNFFYANTNIEIQ